MGVVRPLHAGGRVNQVPCLRHPGDQPVHGNSDQFGMGTRPALDETEHPVPHSVRLHALPDLGHHSGVLRSQHLHAGTRPSADRTVDPGLTRPGGAIGAVHCRRVHLHHDLAARRDGFKDVLEADDLRAAVLRSNRCAHLVSMASAPLPASRPCFGTAAGHTSLRPGGRRAGRPSRRAAPATRRRRGQSQRSRPRSRPPCRPSAGPSCPHSRRIRCRHATMLMNFPDLRVTSPRRRRQQRASTPGRRNGSPAQEQGRVAELVPEVALRHGSVVRRLGEPLPATASTSSRCEAIGSCQPVMSPSTMRGGSAGVMTRRVQPRPATTSRPRTVDSRARVAVVPTAITRPPLSCALLTTRALEGGTPNHSGPVPHRPPARTPRCAT